MHTRTACLFYLLAAAPALRADGSIEGALVLDQPKPVQTSAGYKPVTRQPIQQAEKFVAIVYLENKAKNMRCVLLVLDTPWFTRTDAQGRFKLGKVPAGDYTMKAFLPSERSIEMPVHVDEGKVVKVEFKP